MPRGVFSGLTMKILLGIVVLTLTVSCQPQSGGIDCKPYEEYREAPCEVTCDNVLNVSCLTAEKRPGCYCKTGTIRDEDGQCISTEVCSKRVCTKENQQLDMSGCFTVCTGLGTSYSGCPFVPQAGCNCDPGFAVARGIRGDCIPVSSCREPN